MSTSPTGPRQVALCALATVAAFGLIGCSSSEDEAADTCAEMQTLAQEVRGLADVDVMRTGLDGLEQQTDDISAAWDAVKDSGGDQFDSELDGLETAVTSLTDTLKGSEGDGDSLGDNISNVQTEIAAVADAWSTLMTAVDSELGDCDLSSTGD